MNGCYMIKLLGEIFSKGKKYQTQLINENQTII